MEYPILIFPTHLKMKRDPGNSAPPQFLKPLPGRLRERISGRFQDLQRVIEKCDANLDTSEEDLTPDRVVIFEVVGSVANFIKAAQKAGFEWLGTMHSEMGPSDDFPAIKIDPKTKEKMIIEKTLTTTLYAMLPTLEGMKKLLRLWDQWNRGETKFEENLAPFKDVLSQLIDIRRWGKKERLLEGFASYLDDISDGNPSQMIKVEIEIWPFKSKDRRETALSSIESLIKANGGKLLADPCNLEEACYHAVLAEIPIQCARAIDKSDLASLITCDDIQFFGPKAQTLISIPSITDDPETLPKRNKINNQKFFIKIL